MKELAQIFKALSDESRLEILGLLLVGGDLCVCDVEGALGITQSKSSRHLRYLLNSKLVENHRQGVWMHYRITDSNETQHGAILAAIRTLIPEEQKRELETRLATWRKKKEVEATSCTG